MRSQKSGGENCHAESGGLLWGSQGIDNAVLGSFAARNMNSEGKPRLVVPVTPLWTLAPREIGARQDPNSRRI